MFLVKCSCGCMYTLQDKNLNYTRPGSSRHCPNCAMRHEFTTSLTVATMPGEDFEVHRIPDSAKIEVKFDY